MPEPPRPPDAERLAAGFAPVTGNDWRRAAERALHGEPLSALDFETPDGIRLHPVYPLRSPGAVIPGRMPGARWRIIQRVDAADVAMAAAQIAEDLANGADGVDLVFAGSPHDRGAGLPPRSETLPAVLKVVPAGAQVRFDAGAQAGPLARILLSASRSIAMSVTIAADPAALVAAGRADRDQAEDMTLDLATSLRAPRKGGPSAVSVAVADGRVWHQSGATTAQELGAALAALVHWLRVAEAAGLDLGTAAQAASVTLAATPDQFLTIAKFRASRLLHGRLLAAAGLAGQPAMIHAETAGHVAGGAEPMMNLMRAGVAAFAAGIGGADSITVLPFSDPADALARRLARNTGLILMSEAQLAAVGDPAAGAGAVEALTDGLARAAWAEFQAIEAAGGLLAAVTDGWWQARIGAAATAAEAEVAG